jgi:hypothetical protein
VPAKTLEYYRDVYGDGLEQKEDTESITKLVNKGVESNDTSVKVECLKDIVRRFAELEFRPEKYSLVAYLVNLDYVDKPTMAAIYKAYSDEDDSGLDDKQREIYEKALAYSLFYYKFLTGLFAILG